MEASDADGTEEPYAWARALFAATVGSETLERLKQDPRELVAGGTDSLRSVLGQWGYSTAQTDALCEMIELQFVFCV